LMFGHLLLPLLLNRGARRTSRAPLLISATKHAPIDMEKSFFLMSITAGSVAIHGGPASQVQCGAREAMKKRVEAVPEDRAATPAEIEAALVALTDDDLNRLRAFAEYHESLLQEKAQGRDLLGEAFERLLQGSRKWDKTKSGLLSFLFAAMRSIRNAWFRAKASPTEAPVFATSLIVEDGDGNTTSVVDEFASPEPDISYLLVCRETLQKIDEVLADDEEAQMVLEGFRDGQDPAAIREFWGLSQTQYNAITTRMRRKIRKAGITEPREGARHAQ